MGASGPIGRWGTVQGRASIVRTGRPVFGPGPFAPPDGRSVRRSVSTDLDWHSRPGLYGASRYLRRTPVEVVETPLKELPRLSPRAIRLALRLVPSFLDRADLDVPIIVAGRGFWQIALDGRHRISKAIWTGRASLPSVRVPWRFALELLVPGPYEAEWLYRLVRRGLRAPALRRRRPLRPRPRGA